MIVKDEGNVTVASGSAFDCAKRLLALCTAAQRERLKQLLTRGEEQAPGGKRTLGDLLYERELKGLPPLKLVI